MQGTTALPPRTGGCSSPAPQVCVRVTDVATKCQYRYCRVAPLLAADSGRDVTSLFLFVVNKPLPSVPTQLPVQLRGADLVAVPRGMGALSATLHVFALL